MTSKKKLKRKKERVADNEKITIIIQRYDDSTDNRNYEISHILNYIDHINFLFLD